jgi:hypothetical protein
MSGRAVVRRVVFGIPATAAFFAACLSSACAQYDDPRLVPPSPPRYAGVSLGHTQFTPTGSGTIDYGTLVGGLVFHQEPMDLLFGYAAYDLGHGDLQSLSVATTVGFDIPLQGTPGGGLFMPVVITGDYMKAEASDVQRDDFNVGSIGLGTGLKARIAGDRWEFEARGAASAQYSFEGFSVGTGFSWVLFADATAAFRSVPVLDGLAVGYRFRMQEWNMHDTQFDYRSVEHVLFLGVLF